MAHLSGAALLIGLLGGIGSAQCAAEGVRGKQYDGIKTMQFSHLLEDKRMKMVVFHWDGEGEGDLINTVRVLQKKTEFSDYLWNHVDVSTDTGAQAEFSKESLPMTFSQTPEDGIGVFNGGDFNVDNFRE